MPASSVIAPVELRVARIAAAAAVLGAVVGALGVGVPAFISSERQISASAARESQAFLRPQRMSAYTQFLADLRDLEGPESAIDRMIYAEGARPTITDWSRVVANLDRAFDKISQSYASVRLLGSRDAAATAETLINHHSILYWTIQSAGKYILENKPYDEHFDKGNVHYGVEATTQGAEDFNNQARTDLGSG